LSENRAKRAVLDRIIVIGYNYFDVEESLLETTATKVNIWTFNEEYFKLSVELLQSTFDKTNVSHSCLVHFLLLIQI